MYKLPIQQQHDAMDCGPTCLAMICEYYGKHYNIEYLHELCYISNEGVSLYGISIGGNFCRQRKNNFRYDAVHTVNSPVDQLINFIRQHQDAQLSLNRLQDVYRVDNEDDDKKKRINS